MSNCLVLQGKNFIAIGADTASSVLIDGKYRRIGTDSKKLYRFGNEIMFCSGRMTLVELVTSNIAMKDNKIVLDDLTNFIESLNIQKADTYDLEILICGVENDKSYMHQISQYNDFEVKTITNDTSGCAVYSTGFNAKTMLDTAKKNYPLCQNISNLFTKSFADISSDEIGGYINMYLMKENQITKCVNNYKVDDIKTISVSNNDIHFVIADCLIGDLIFGKTLHINNGKDTLTMDENGLTITNGVNTIIFDPNNTELMNVTNNDKKIFYLNELGDLFIDGNIFGGSLHLENDNGVYVDIDPDKENIFEIGAKKTSRIELANEFTQIDDFCRIENYYDGVLYNSNYKYSWDKDKNIWSATDTTFQSRISEYNPIYMFINNSITYMVCSVEEYGKCKLLQFKNGLYEEPTVVIESFKCLDYHSIIGTDEKYLYYMNALTEGTYPDMTNYEVPSRISLIDGNFTINSVKIPYEYNPTNVIKNIYNKCVYTIIDGYITKVSFEDNTYEKLYQLPITNSECPDFSDGVDGNIIINGKYLHIFGKLSVYSFTPSDENYHYIFDLEELEFYSTSDMPDELLFSEGHRFVAADGIIYLNTDAYYSSEYSKYMYYSWIMNTYEADDNFLYDAITYEYTETPKYYPRKIINDRLAYHNDDTIFVWNDEDSIWEIDDKYSHLSYRFISMMFSNYYCYSYNSFYYILTNTGAEGRYLYEFSDYSVISSDMTSIDSTDDITRYNYFTYSNELDVSFQVITPIGIYDKYLICRMSDYYYQNGILKYDLETKEGEAVAIDNPHTVYNFPLLLNENKLYCIWTYWNDDYTKYLIEIVYYDLDEFDGKEIPTGIVIELDDIMSSIKCGITGNQLHIWENNYMPHIVCDLKHGTYRKFCDLYELFNYKTTYLGEQISPLRWSSIYTYNNSLYAGGIGTDSKSHMVKITAQPSTNDAESTGETEKIMYVTNTGEAWYGGGINVNNNFIVDKDGNVTLPPGTTISWSDVQGTENIATSDDISSTKNTIMTEIGDTYVKTTEIEANIAHLGGWTIAKNGLISPDFGDYTTGTSGLALYSDGNILNRGLWTGQDNTWYAYLYRGKWIFGLGNYFGATANEQYSDISANGIYMCSKDTILNNSSQYLFAVNTTNDTVTITNSSNTSPALTITNNYYDTDNSNYDAPALVLHSPYQGYRNRPLDVRMKVTGEILGTGQTVDNEYCMQMFGEQEYGRIIFRSSKIVTETDDDGNTTSSPQGNTADTESSDPLVPGMIGSSTFRWFQGYFMELYSTNGLNTSSDKKIKNHIQDIDANKSLELINSLTPVEYTLKNNANNRKHMGFYAQDVKKTCDDMELGNMSLYAATWHKDGQEQECYYSEDAPDEELQWTLKYEEFIAPLVGAVQALTKRVEDLEADNEKLRTRIEKLEDVSE